MVPLVSVPVVHFQCEFLSLKTTPLWRDSSAKAWKRNTTPSTCQRIGEQARALASELDYDLLVLDLNLPRLDGVAILKQVRTKKPNVPMLILTARGKVEDREKIRRPQRSLDDLFLMRREFLRRER